MKTNRIQAKTVFSAAVIALSLLLAAWVLLRASESGFRPETELWMSIGLAVMSAGAAALFGRSTGSAMTAAVFASLITVGGVTGCLLGNPVSSVIPEMICATAVFLLVFLFAERLMKLLEYRWFLVGAAVLSVAVYAVTLLAARRTGGAALGIDILGRSVQIFELGKPLYIIVTASVMCIRSLRPSSKLLIVLGYTLAHCALLLMQSELGTMLCIIAACAGQLTVWLGEPAAALRAAFWDRWRKFVFIPAVAAVAGAAALILSLYPYIIDKVTGRLKGWLDGSYQIECGERAMINGGLFGSAGGEQVYIPYADSDMVFPSVVQLFGLAAGALLLLVVLFFGVTVFSCTGQLRDTHVCAVAAGSAVMLVTQTLIAVCASTGLIPMTGITLPVISNGGVSLSVCAAFAGLIAWALRSRKESAA